MAVAVITVLLVAFGLFLASQIARLDPRLVADRSQVDVDDPAGTASPIALAPALRGPERAARPLPPGRASDACQSGPRNSSV